MNWSKLNPTSWFQKPARPNDMTPTLPKYRAGQRCLVLQCGLSPKLVGTEVVLSQVVASAWSRRLKSEINGVYWRLTCRPMADREDKLGSTELVFREKDLLPIDDEDINAELRKEAVDDLEAKQVELVRAFKDLDQALTSLEESVKRQKERRVI